MNNIYVQLVKNETTLKLNNEKLIQSISILEISSSITTQNLGQFANYL